MTEPHLYVLVRRDLSRSAQAVQAIHATLELVYRRGSSVLAEGWGQIGPTVSLLQVDDGVALERWQARLGSAAAIFHEPDLGDIPTALAYYGADSYGLCELRLL